MLYQLSGWKQFLYLQLVKDSDPHVKELLLTPDHPLHSSIPVQNYLHQPFRQFVQEFLNAVWGLFRDLLKRKLLLQ